MIYGEPRLTHDVDLVLELEASDADRLVQAFPLKEFYVPPEEVVELEARRAQRGSFNIIHHATGYKCDIYVCGRDPLHSWALSKRRAVQLADSTVWFAPPEYVILRKLEFYREGKSPKHLADIRGMLATSQIDVAEVDRRAGELGLSAEWNSVRDTV
ncbi:MAG: hypothetical protein HY791_09910 [Deltaproteobacteria bacterium]|nr:hypothetical protein [Deltaproteobacteria bacterium]